MLAQKLKEIRRQRGITQEETANFLQVKRQTYGAYERGVSKPDSPTLKRLADFFGVSTEFFFRDDAEDDVIRVQNEEEERLLILARRAEKIPPQQRERIIRAFEENIDMYLEALGAAEQKKPR